MKKAKEKVRRLSKEEVFGIILNLNRVAILDLLYEQKGISWSMFRRKLGISKGQLNYHLKKLVETGLVVKKTPKANRPIYELTPAGIAVTKLSKRIRQAIREAIMLTESGR